MFKFVIEGFASLHQKKNVLGGILLPSTVQDLQLGQLVFAHNFFLMHGTECKFFS